MPATAAQVRAWAKSNDIPVGTRGHLSRQLVSQFNKGKRAEKRYESKNPSDAHA